MEPVTRRQWLELAGLGGVGTLLSLTIPSDSIPGESLNFAAWYNRYIQGHLGESFTRPDFMAVEKVDYTHIPLFKQAVAERARDFADGLGPGRARLKIKVEDSIFFEFTPTTIPHLVFQDWTRRNIDAANNFLAFMGITQTLDIQFHRFGQHTEIQGIQPTELHFYVTGRTAKKVKAGFAIHQGDAHKEGDMAITQDPTPGHTHYVIYFRRNQENGSYFLSHITHEPVFISLDVNPVKGYTSVPAEVLHLLLPGRELHLNALISNAWEAAGRRTLEQPEILAVLTEYAQREEGIVHALLDEYVRQYAGLLGFSNGDLESYLHTRTEGDYHYVPSLRERLNEIGPRAFIRVAKDNPTSLFS